MFKLQDSIKSMNFDNNVRKSNEATNSKSIDKNLINSFGYMTMQNSTFPFKESSIFRLSHSPPLYFFRKPKKYVYNIHSVPPYLVRTDQEKNFVMRLWKGLKYEKNQREFLLKYAEKSGINVKELDMENVDENGNYLNKNKECIDGDKPSKGNIDTNNNEKVDKNDMKKYRIKTTVDDNEISKSNEETDNNKDNNKIKASKKFKIIESNRRKDRYYPKVYNIYEMLRYRPDIFDKCLENERKNKYNIENNKNQKSESGYEEYQKKNSPNSTPNSQKQKKLKQKPNIHIIKDNGDKNYMKTYTKTYTSSYPKIEKITNKRDNSNNNLNDNIYNNTNKYAKTTTNINENSHSSRHLVSSLSPAEKIKYKYTLSDIFNTSKDKIFLNKSSEKYLFRQITPKNNGFYSTSRSRSDWITKIPTRPNMNTYSSVKYNILSPCVKGGEMFKNATVLNSKNKYNEASDYHKLKSISEFIDLTRVSANNPLNSYNMNMNKNMPDFKYVNNLCNDHMNAYNNLRCVIPSPF